MGSKSDFSDMTADSEDYCEIRASSRLAPSQWETSLQSNTVSHWLGANQESALEIQQLPVPTRCAFPHTNASYLGVPPSGMRGPLWHLKPYNGLEFLCSMVNWWWPIRIWNEIEYLRYNLHTCVYMITLLIFPPYQRIKISGKYTTKTTNYLMLTR